jgi:formate hydrogenlyase transcriptional activator
MSLVLFDPASQTGHLYALDAGPDNPGIPLGTELSFRNTALASALKTQQPVFVPNVRDLLKTSGLAEGLRLVDIECAYVFPISSSRRSLGFMGFGSKGRQQYTAADVELMSSVAAHISVAVESALALESAESYQRQLVQERDRLQLLLEINNHVVSRLDINELFRAACASIREYFDNDFTGIWLIDKERNSLECAALDFPKHKGLFLDYLGPELIQEDLEKLRARQPRILTREEINKLPGVVLERLNEDGIESVVIAPLGTSNGPLGVIMLGSRRSSYFRPDDLSLLMQVGTQISLALENAVAYRRLNLSHHRLEEEKLYLESEIKSEYNFEDIVGRSPEIRKVFEQVSIVAPTDSTVLLVGETGTGKELFARAIHNLSARQNHTFVRLNCASIPHGLLESELFGHEKGAFTGALMQKRGRLEVAHEGSLFLDEIGDIDLSLQPKLLRVLQEREFERLGSNRTTKVDVRLIAATNRDLPEMVRNSEFREDLYYRLNVFPISIPPLRERKEDIPILVHHFAGLIARKMRKTIRVIPREVMQAMMNWSWPGNVRELQNFVERSVILTRGDTLTAPVSELGWGSPVKASATEKLPPTDRDAILEALRASQGRLSGAGGAAERLGLKRTTLLKRMARLNISRSDVE